MIGSGVELGVAQIRPADAAPGLFNWDARLLPRTRKALANVRNGTAPFAINFYGDSGFTGFGAGSGLGFTGAWAKSIPAVFAKLFRIYDRNGNPVPVRRSSFWSNQCAGYNTSTVADMANWDSRFTASGGWNLIGVSVGPGGSLLNTSSAGTLTLTPEEAYDRVNSYFVQGPGAGNCTVTAGAGTPDVVNNNAGANAFTGFHTTSAASNTTQATTISFGTTGVFLVGAEMYSSGVNDIRVRNLAWNGAQSNDFIGTGFPWSPLTALPVIGGDLSFVRCYRNDQNASVSPSTFKSRMQTFITQLKTFSDVILLRGHAPSASAFNLANDAAFVSALKDLALSNSCPLMDVVARMDTYENANSFGWYYSDNVHYNAIGQSQEAAWPADLIARL